MFRVTGSIRPAPVAGEYLLMHTKLHYVYYWGIRDTGAQNQS